MKSYVKRPRLSRWAVPRERLRLLLDPPLLEDKLLWRVFFFRVGIINELIIVDNADLLTPRREQVVFITINATIYHYYFLF